MLRRFALVLLLVFFVCLGAHAADIDMLMGNPSKATTDPTNTNNYLMNKEYFVLLYNDSKGTPNWVSWRLDKKYLGNFPHLQVFATDDTLPDGFTRITHQDYTGSGFDRGHMRPHADRNNNDHVNESTFITTNIVPQSHELNAGAWEQLEMYCRHLVENQGKKLYIVAGPEGVGGEGKHGFEEKIGGSKVTVPQSTWKVIMVLDGGDDDNDIARVNENTQLIAVNMPNNREVPKDDWSQYLFTVNDLEKSTGYKFFDKVPTEVIEPLKMKKYEAKEIPVLKRPHE